MQEDKKPASGRMLTSKGEIIDFLGITDHKFDTMVALGLIAAVYLNGRWYAHTDNLEQHFKLKTNVVTTEPAGETSNEKKP